MDEQQNNQEQNNQQNAEPTQRSNNAAPPFATNPASQQTSPFASGQSQQSSRQQTQQATQVNQMPVQENPYQPQIVEPPQKKQKGDKQRKAHPFAVGVLGGIVGAALCGGVWLGVSNLTATTTTQNSSAGPTISITTNSEDVSVAEAVASKCLPSLASLAVTTASGSGMGSGVVYDTQGNIITNNHVVDGAQTIDVTINGKSYDGKVVGNDASSDLAVVKIDPGSDTLTPMEIANSDDIVVGEWVMSLGSPFGFDQSVSTGVVSALYRSTVMQGTSGNTIYTNLIQTDAAINPGNSGGALVDKEGKLIGINSVISSTSGASAGVGFAIPSNLATEEAEQIIAGKKVEHAALGASVATVTAQLAAKNGLPVTQGAYVQSVQADSAAQKAGIEQGDIITKVGDTDITTADGLVLAVRSQKVGDKVQITYFHGLEQRTVEVELGTDNGESNSVNPNAQQQTPNSGLNGLDGNNGSGNSLGQDPLDILRELLGQ